MISRRALAQGIGQKTASLARRDRRGTGPGRPITISATHVVYREEEVASWLRARGLEWAGGTVRQIQDDAAGAGTPATIEENHERKHFGAAHGARPDHT